MADNGPQLRSLRERRRTVRRSARISRAARTTTLSVAYHIQDEPLGGGRGLPALNPFWPLLAMMLGGAWIGAAAFAFNAWALRGPTWLREIGLAAAVLIGSPIILLGIGYMNGSGIL